MHSSIIKTPVGNLAIAGDGTFITRINFTLDDTFTEDEPLILECTRQLKAYFEGKLKEFNLPLNQPGTEFQKDVWNELMKIPAGTTISYRELSNRLGKPGTERAVGSANGRNNIAIVVPCHRVIGNDGSLTGYAGGLHHKDWLLQHEFKFWKPVYQQQLFG